MNSPLANAIAKSGILDGPMLEEFRKWGVFPEVESGPPPRTAEEVVRSLQAALESEGLVLEKVTDLEVLHQFIHTQEVGVLHMIVDTEEGDFRVVYGRTPLGEYIFSWFGEAVAEEIINGLSYLTTAADEKVYFQTLREFYYGDQKTFMVCTQDIKGLVSRGNAE